MYNMVMTLGGKEWVRINSNTFELVLEALLEDHKKLLQQVQLEGNSKSINCSDKSGKVTKFKRKTRNSVAADAASAVAVVIDPDRRWKEALLVIRTMDKCGFRPSLGICVVLVEVLEKARQYRAVLALYNYMVMRGYDFYENTIINSAFKRLLSLAAPPATAGVGDELSFFAHTVHLGDYIVAEADSPLEPLLMPPPLV